MTLTDLTIWGWNAKWDATYRLCHESGDPGRVLAVYPGMFRVVTPSGVQWAEVAGRLRVDDENLWPAMGDFVVVRPGTQAQIIRVLERRSALVRNTPGEAVKEQVIAANADTAFLMQSLDRDFNLRRLERYLTMAWQGNTRPVVLLTKADLAWDSERMKQQAVDLAVGVPVHCISAATGFGMHALQPYLIAGQSIACVGSSGVGKSTLINALCPDFVRLTQTLGNNLRGRHTTTHRELYRSDSGALIADTPGMRELQLFAGDVGMDMTFPEVQQWAAQCRYRDCRHQGEPGCQVALALQSGAITPQRLAAYEKLQRELQHLEDRHDPRAYAQSRKRWKKATKAGNQNRRFKQDGQY